MNYLDLFSGIGGFRLGLKWSGFEKHIKNYFHSDIDKYANEVYKKRFPESIQLGDITKIDFEELKNKYPGEWIISGGFPCQDLSIAGKREGIKHGNRSGLWYEMFRSIRVLLPKFAIIENVPGILISGLSIVLENLAEIGYNAEWQCISAESIGAWHKRERIWIISYPYSF